MKKFIFGSLAIAFVFMGGVLWKKNYEGPTQNVEVTSVAKNLGVGFSDSKPLGRLGPNSSVAPSLLKPATDDISTDDGIKRLQAAIQEASAYADDEKRNAEFEKSGLDTAENFRAAMDTLRAPYQEPVSEEQAKKKVVAIFFLGLSKHLDNVGDCSTTLEDMEVAYKGAREEKTRFALLADAGDLSKACVGVDEDAFRSTLLAMPAAPIRNQAIANIGEDS